MSNTSNCIMGGISITWKIEKFSAIPKEWRTSIPLDWVMTESKWNIEIIFVTQTKQSTIEVNKKGISLLLKKTDDGKPFILMGTLSAISENICFQLCSIDGYDFRKKSVWVTPFTEIDWGNEGLINKNSVTLRINLWKTSINDLVVEEYFIRSTCIQQICSFQWTMNWYVHWKYDAEYYITSTEVPMEFIDFDTLQRFRLKLSLQVIDRDIFPIIEAKEFNQKNFFIQGRYKIEIQTEGGSDLHLLDEDWKQYHFNSYRGDRMRDIDGIEKIIYSECVAKIEILLVTFSIGVIEKICFESKLRNSGRQLEISEKKQLTFDNMQQSIKTLYEEGKFCDVILRVDSETFPCHKTVLCARSPVFQTMFENDMREKETSVVNIGDTESKILRTFLSYLYSDTIEAIDFDSLMKLYAVADKYEVLSLQKKCADMIVSCLSTDNVSEVLDLADSHQDDDLKKEILLYFCNYSKEIVASSSWKTLFLHKPSLAAETLQAVVSSIR